MLNGKRILVTGGTGSFGKSFIHTVLKMYPDIERIVVYSRDELKQYEMAQLDPPSVRKKIRYFIGDVRDQARFTRAAEGIDIIIHAAALKHVPAAEYNPIECIKTNILGAENVIHAALANNVEKVIALSTDKAAAPINLYGATKLCSDKLFVAANNMKGSRKLEFSVVRYGNVMASRGSVIPFFLKQREKGFIPITHESMTRFNITLQESIDLVLLAIKSSWGGEIFVPKIPSYRVLDLAEAIAPGVERKVVGVRPGEKLHESLITDSDAVSTLEFDEYYVILPAIPTWSRDEYMAHFGGKEVPEGFSYNSGSNTEWLSVDQIRNLMKTHVDPNF